MADEYIEREVAKHYAKHAYAKGLNVLDYLDEVPAADVRPVVHDTHHMEEALQAVIAERKRQIKLFGDQSGTPLNAWLGILGEEFGELCEAINESTFENSRHPERGGIDNVFKEATHVAAVAVQLMEAILSGFRPACGANMREVDDAADHG